MTREEKQAFVAEMRDRLANSEAVFLADFTGLDVKAMTTLRRELKNANSELLVVKNRLFRLAMAETEMPDISTYLTGPTGVVFGDDTVVGAARVVVDFAKENDDKPVFKVGVLDNSVLEAEDIVQVSRLPSREELLSQVAGVLSGPMSAFVSALGGKTQEMAGLVEALREQGESQAGGN